LWTSLSYERGPRQGVSKERKLYEDIEKGRKKISNEFLLDFPKFAAAFKAIFGDPHRIPSYGHFRKMVRIARTFGDPAIWDRLPDSFEAIYQFTFIAVEDRTKLMESGAVCKTTSMERVEELRKEHSANYKTERQLREANAVEHWLRRGAKQHAMRQIELAKMVTSFGDEQRAVFARIASMSEDETARYIETHVTEYLEHMRQEKIRIASLTKEQKFEELKPIFGGINLSKQTETKTKAQKDAEFEAWSREVEKGLDAQREKAKAARLRSRAESTS